MIERLNAALEGRYRIERELGEGGMATVFLAEDLKHDRMVALKVLKPELAAVVGAERFLAEIRTTANLEDPHILPLYDSGEADSFLFYVMPYVEGDTLRDRLDRERQLPVGEAVAIARKVAGALEYAHQQGVVHRDIKPANILLRRGEPLVADFGIALALSEAGGGRITETGLSLGTPHYMSPEQAAGERSLDVRSDVYALGCVLFEMLTGEPPHAGPTAQSVLAKILTDQPRRVSELRRAVPAHVEGAVAQSLEKLPADRFDSIAAFEEALGDPDFRYEIRGGAADVRSGTGGGRGVGAASHRSTRARWITAVALVTLAGLAAAGWLRPAGESSPLLMVRLAVPDSQASVQRNSPRMDLSRDGRRLVYVGPGGGDGMLWLQELDKLGARPLRGTEGAHTPSFSPDGNSVAYVTGTPGDLRVVGLHGEAPVTVIRDSAYAYGLSWADDGWLYLTDDIRIRRIRSQGGILETIEVPDTERGETWRGWPHILPGGRYLLFSTWKYSATDAEIGIRDLETGREAILTVGLYPRYARSGHVVFTRVDGTLMAAPLDTDGLALAAEPAAIFGDLSVNTGEGYSEIAISASGTMVYRPGTSHQQQLFRVARDGSEVPVDTSFIGQFGGVSLSPDGRRLVAAVTTQDDGNIYVMDLSGGPWRRVSFEPGVKSRPRWVPGQEAVTYLANDELLGEGSATHLVQASADGSGNARVILETAQWLQSGVWSPDGAWLVYRVGPVEGARRDIYALRPGDTGDTVAIAVTRFDEHSPAISPDGRYVAYVSDESGRPEVFVRPFPAVTGGKWQVSTSGGSEPVWGRTGRELFYRASNGAMTAARYVVNPSFTVVDRTELFPAGAYAADPYHPSYDISPDDQHFLLARGDVVDEPLVLVQNWFQELLTRVEGSRR